MQATDIQQKFLIDSCDVRGQMVKLCDTWREAVARVDYPESVRQILGEAFVATTLLASTIKFDGRMTLQVRGEGPVHLLVVQISNNGQLRGLARWQAEPADSSLPSAFGADSRMSITIEAKKQGQQYQGIVPLEGESLSEALQLYFNTSEQLPTRLHLAVSDDIAAGMLIQKLPVEERTAHDEDGWQRAKLLSATISPGELCREDPMTLLHRMFHEEQVRVFDSETIVFHCSCSRERTSGMLLGLGEEEVNSIVQEQGKVEITCEFCDSVYLYDAVDASALFKTLGADSDTRLH
ncbi:MAG: Hsp33 family molecular chaperone HslO [Granulosicoccus sp.]